MLKFFFKSAAFLFLAAVLNIQFLSSTVRAEAPATKASQAQAREAAPVSSGSVDAEDLVRRARDLKLHERLQWRRLLHYIPRYFNRGLKSQAANSAFFIDPNGKYDPEAELMATLREGLSGRIRPPALEKAPPMSVRCQFPARWKWLMHELQVADSELPPVSCEKLDEFRARTQAKSVTLVFSAYFVNNPSTVFGHVLLRLNKEAGGARTGGAELLDLGVSYAANATTSNALLYAIFGMTGIFPGTFTALPYYYKVREYSDAESRDLWEYDLSLTQDEVDRLVDHVWELGSTHFNYFYFDENCAYHLLAALETAAPRLNLIDRIPFYVIPVDSVKAVTAEPGLVTRVHYRPSTQRQLTERYESFDEREKAVFLRIRNSEKPAEQLRQENGLTPESAARVLDAVLDHIDYRYFGDLVRKANPEAAARKQNVLLARAKLPAGGEINVKVAKSDQPDQSHSSARFFFGAGAFQHEAGGTQQALIDAEVRFALHGFGDPSQGYLPFANVEFWRMQGRYVPDTKNLRLQSFSLFTVSSLQPFSRLETSYSWRVDTGFHRLRDQRCDDCLAAQFHALGGMSTSPFKSVLVYGLIGPLAETSSDFNREKWIINAAGRVGVRWRFARQLGLATEGEWRRVFDRETFDRLSSSARLRYDFDHQGRPIGGLEASYERELANQDWFFRSYWFF